MPADMASSGERKRAGVGIVGNGAFRVLDVRVERGERHAALLEAERRDRRLRACHDALDRQFDRDVGLLLDIVHDSAGRLGALIHVHAEGVDAGGVLNRLEDAPIRSGGRRKDAIGSIRRHRRAAFLSPRRVGERVVAANPQGRGSLHVGFDVL
jgi:hypothetical protein